VSGRELAWFFELYLRQPKLPRLVHALSGKELSLAWETPAGLSFPMPVPLVVDGETRRVEMPGGRATVALERAQGWELDPRGWILVEAP
jgi:aminopeptidase N